MLARRALLLCLVATLAGGCGGGSASTTPAATAPTHRAIPASAPVGAVEVGRDGRVRYSGNVHRPTAARRVAATVPSARAAAGPVAARPPIVQRPISFGAKRKAEMAAYSRRHYGDSTYRLTSPKVLVEHFTETPTFAAAYAIFAKDVPDSELHELPQTCAHFVVDKDGTIFQLVPISIRCRHTVGLNQTAIGIEQVGMSASEILARPAQRRAIARLSAWLRCREGISMANVIGHAMSLSSPYHHEDVAALRSQTHDDWHKAELAPIKRQIAKYRCA